jgi:hypothetical protein
MTKVPEPHDALGNLIVKDSFVTIQWNTPPVFKVIAIESGGIHTANGITPAVVRVVCDMTLRQIPGVPFTTLASLRTPGAEDLLAKLGPSLVES